MNKEKLIKWAKSTGIKTVKTMAQTAVGTITGSALLSDVNWPVVASASILSGITCILMNISSIEEA